MPAALRRVAGYSGPKLPPPLAQRLLGEIDSNDWVREFMAEGWDPAGADAEASTLFLLRPDGWEVSLEARAAAIEQTRTADRVAALERELAEMREENERNRRRARQVQREAELAIAEADRRVTAARSASVGQRHEEQEEITALAREVAALRRALDEAAHDVEASRERVRALRSELLRAKRAARPAPTPTGPRVWAAADPLARARILDEVRAAYAPASEFAEVQLPLDSGPLQLPAGISPDRAGAVGWLLESRRALVWIVDGYNVTHQLSPELATDARTRERLNRDLGRLRGLAIATPRVVVVYDSSLAGTTTAAAGPGGIEVRFTAHGHSADDEILEMAAELDGAAVVISSDRQVRESAQRLGALGIWTEALVDWIRTS